MKFNKLQYILLLFCSFFCLTSFSQTITISGSVSDKETGEMILGAQIMALPMKKGVISNVYGFYSLTIADSVESILVKSSTYKSLLIQIANKRDTVINIELKPEVKEFETVSITGTKSDNINSTQLGQIELSMEEIKLLPAFMGEVDVLKTIQLLPGVSSISEGGQGFYVRGGGPDQNLVLLDEAIVYNASHLFGFFSVFNPDAVKNINLIKGGMPANFGGRMSSVLEINMKEGNNKKLSIKGGLGLISSRLTIESPIKKDKGSFIFSARRTYIDILLKPFIPKESPFSGSGYFFYDLNFKANYTLNDKNRFFISSYYGKDLFNYGNKQDDFTMEMPWGNGIVAARWNHIFSQKVFLNVTSTFSDYLFGFKSKQDIFRFELNSGIQDYGTKVDFSYYPNSKHKIKWGADYIFHRFTPTSVSVNIDDVKLNTGDAQRLYSHESALYVLDEIEFTPRFKMNVGFRYSMYHQVGPFTRYIKDDIANPDSTVNYMKGDLISFYHGPEPRVSFRFVINENSSIKAGYSYNYQYVHLTSMSAVSLPTDIWYPTTDVAKPQQGSQYTTGYFRNFFKNKLETSVEVYYKDMRNLIEYKEGALPADNVSENTDDLLTFGRGWSYGIEFFLKKTSGRFTGWIGYTWSKTERLFSDLNQGLPFPAKYDRRHDFSLVGTYKIDKRLILSTTYIYATGNTLTLPTSWFVHENELLYNYGPKNATRMNDYHRLDISLTYYDKPFRTKTDKQTGETIQIEKKIRSNWAFSIYNLYNRANPFFLYIDPEGNIYEGDFKIKVKQVSLFPIIPSITWNFEF
jgi:hypothetical protein